MILIVAMLLVISGGIFLFIKYRRRRNPPVNAGLNSVKYNTQMSGESPDTTIPPSNWGEAAIAATRDTGLNSYSVKYPPTADNTTDAQRRLPPPSGETTPAPSNWGEAAKAA